MHLDGIYIKVIVALSSHCLQLVSQLVNLLLTGPSQLWLEWHQRQTFGACTPGPQTLHADHGTLGADRCIGAAAAGEGQ